MNRIKLYSNDKKKARQLFLRKNKTAGPALPDKQQTNNYKIDATY